MPQRRQFVRSLLRAAVVGLALCTLGLLGCDGLDDQPTLVSFAATDDADQPTLSYNRDIRPILSDNCFSCHGPDHSSRKADLRLDRREGNEEVDGAEIVLKGGASSELVSRINSASPKQVMPPPESKRTLSAEQKELLSRWVAQGGVYEEHWSFQPVPTRVEPPAVTDEAWVRDDIDRFVLARLEAEGIPPSPEASRERWLRRVSYDLTGLPPSISEIEAFLADRSATAYDSVVDRLLASPRFGERMAIPWLDLARYADTYGYSVDGYRAVWPWRDWLVAALNNNMPYDEFITDLLAGDLKPDATREDRLATAFNRLHRMNAEGGAIREEWRNEYVSDRVHTFGTAFLGLTLECARCHDHKFDPIEQRDYYALSAFFNNIDESGTTEYQRPDIIPPPSMLLPDADQEAERTKLLDAIASAEAKVTATTASRESAFAEWLATEHQAQIPDLVGDYPLDAIGDGGVLENTAAGGEPGHALQHESVRTPESDGSGAVRVDGDNVLHFPGVSDLDRWTPITIAVRFRVDAIDDGPPRVVAHRTSGTDVGPFGFDLVLEGGRLAARCYRSWPGNAIGVRTGPAVQPGAWVDVVWRYDGSSRATGMTLWINGERAEVETVRQGPLIKRVGGGNPYGPGGQDLVIGQRFRDRGLEGSSIDRVRIVRRAVSDLEAEQLAGTGALSRAIADGDAASLRGFYFSAIDSAARAATGELEAARKRLVEFEDSISEIAIMEEMADPRPAFVLARGAYDAPKTNENCVGRDVPARVSPWPDGLERDRLGLAEWVTSPGNPLAARVEANRLWRICFGTGIVSTGDDFGLQGAWPTHPELLNDLARSLVDSGWDTKALLRRIVLSATYRQDSAATAEQWRLDPDNALLSRGPARRLAAEMIRDSALAASGLLVERLGGPPVYPYQPPGLWESVNGASYTVGSGEALYRRSLYTVWKRAVPVPSMMAFDAPTREACTAQRSETNTPLQALVLLNDVQYVEAARVLAARVMTEAGGDDERITLGFRLLTGRTPTGREAELLRGLLDRQRGLYTDGSADPTALLAQGASPVSEELDPVEQAAMATVMHAIMNLDAAVWLR